ncbi:bifunctional rhamnulose-1-phosphate aldolase/short-chain dehydrogenase [Rhodobacteraceae bacterium CYK-10]|uniref:Bifunctional rhamnulose-1-phosphate aldolase/short-chain dehydrogenase n=1 Tax=Stagnihabitans tardus TaxID=2699202 RepID=A0AAE5BRW8_9RHOB|nr:bifunctional rhamnulose-1-phosphate aldolase/short-chain dehydrogenase [Stagnihabitans tardus]NBZ87080.1 bifunctional rhamnulose-1-phosphate aldolase/short-chain dehydrogenase [Stagnihabitans tardus]
MTDITLPNLWDASKAATMDEPGKLLYRSNLLGSDLRITNFGGGNTSAKVKARDPLTGEEVTVLWVKGSGGDIGSMKLDGFATLYMDKLAQLRAQYRSLDQEDAMVDALGHCIFNLNPRAPSIDTWLHGFVPKAHVDHVHSDAVIAIAACAEQVRLTEEIFGGEIGYLPWQRPGIDLGIKLGELAVSRPDLKGVVLGQHGLFTWADTAEDCYALTLEIINKAAVWLREHGKTPAFGGAIVEALAPAERASVARRLMPLIRGRISKGEMKAGHFTDAAPVLEFVNSAALADLAPMGTSCPDHFLRTKIKPLVVPHDVDEAGLDALLEGYRADYAAYYERCKHANSPAMRDPNAVIYLVPGVGMISFAKDKATARISAEFYLNAINVMRGASGVSVYQGLPEQEAFDIEYWLLEEAKLQRMPKPKSLAGRVAFITGGAGGIGSATADRLLREGCNVVLADIDQASLDEVVAGFGKKYGRDSVRGVLMNVTSEAAVTQAFEATVQAYGGVDIVVNNAGITTAAPVEDTTLAMWNKTMDILSTGYFLVGREGYRIMKTQGIGGSMVFISSKNGVAASPGASAYCTAKAAEIHLARCMALEGAPMGIRVNVVNPDAVLRGSKIWAGEWSQQRAASNKISVDQLEDHYRKRSLLQRSVFPEDIAEGVYFFASDLSNKSTGNFLNVDAGNAVSFTR